MTIVIGVIVDSGKAVIIASDSRGTANGGTGAELKLDNVQKVFFIDEEFGKAIVGWADSKAFTYKAIDLVRENVKASKSKIDSIEPMFEEALWELSKRYCVEKHRKLYDKDPAPDSVIDYENSNSPRVSAHFILAEIVKGKCSLSSIYSDGLAQHEEAFAVTGCGTLLGEWFMQEYYYPEMSVQEALILIFYAIAQTMEVSPHIGGRIQCAILKDGKMSIVPPETIAAVCKQASKLEKRIQETVRG